MMYLAMILGAIAIGLGIGLMNSESEKPKTKSKKPRRRTIWDDDPFFGTPLQKVE